MVGFKKLKQLNSAIIDFHLIIVETANLASAFLQIIYPYFIKKRFYIFLSAFSKKNFYYYFC